MNSYTSWEYLGTTDAPINYTNSRYLHGFYNPVFDKIWCFYSDITYFIFRVGDMINILETEISSEEFVRETVRNTNGAFIGASSDFFQPMLPKLQIKYTNQKEIIFKDFNEEDNVKKVWAF